MNELKNPRESIGGNRPPEAIMQAVTDRLAVDYLEMSKSAANLITSAEEMPERIDNEMMLQGFSNVVVALRDAISRAEATRTAEKEVHLRSGQAVDGFFLGIKERLTRAMNSLHRRVEDYQSRKKAIENERRRLEAEQRAREASEAREREERARREAEEARQAAARARLPENREQKAAIADETERAASQAAAAAAVAADAAEAARIESLRPASETTRSRFDDGRLVTSRRVPYVEVLDPEALDGARLWAYVRPDDRERALRAWAKATNYSRSMPGAIVEMRDGSVVR